MIAVSRSLLAPAALAACCLALASAPGRAQVTPPADTVRAPVPPVPVPTAPRAAVDTAAGDSTRGLSPKKAFFRSILIPGWAQSELGSPVRGGVYFALEAGSLWNLYRADRKLSEARERQRYFRETGRPDQGNGLVRGRQNEREDWITLSVFFLFFSGADAFVTAHLRDFDAHVGTLPRPDGGVQIQATVPVGP